MIKFKKLKATRAYAMGVAIHDADPGDIVDVLVSGSSFVRTGGAYAQDIADAVWAEATASHMTAGIFDKTIDASGLDDIWSDERDTPGPEEKLRRLEELRKKWQDER